MRLFLKLQTNVLFQERALQKRFLTSSLLVVHSEDCEK